LTNRSGTDAADIITTGSGGGSLRYWGLDGDDLFSGINISSGNVDFRLEGSILFDGGAGTDRIVVPADTTCTQGYVNHIAGETVPGLHAPLAGA